MNLHVIIHHYADFFNMNKTNMKNTNGEHHEALHHTLKDFERTKGFFMRKNLGSLIHMQKSLKSISTFNCLRAGFMSKVQLRLRKSSVSSECGSPRSSPKSTPVKRYNHCHAFLLKLEGTARYAGLLLAPAEGFGLRPRLFLPFGQKKSLLCCFGPFLAFFGVQ